MDINRKNMDDLFKSFDLAFREAFLNKAPDTWQKVCMAFNLAKGNAIDFPFLESFSGLHEWIGERQIDNIKSNRISVKVRTFEKTIGAKKNDILDDTYGIYSPMIGQLGYLGGKLWQDLFVEALLSNPNWIDSVAFFKADRKYGSSTIINAVTTALSADSFKTARQTMLAYKGHDGRNLGVNPNLLIVGPGLEDTAFSILKDRLQVSTKTVGEATAFAATDNPNAQRNIDYLVLPEITDSRWYLGATDGVIKPIGIVKRETPVLKRKDSETDDNVFLRGEYWYGTDGRGEAFLAIPHLLYRGGVALEV